MGQTSETSPDVSAKMFNCTLIPILKIKKVHFQQYISVFLHNTEMLF